MIKISFALKKKTTQAKVLSIFKYFNGKNKVKFL